MKKTKFLSFIYLLILVAILPVQSEIYQIESGNIHIKTSAQDTAIAKYLYQVVVGSENRLESFFKIQLNGVVTLMLAPKESDYHSLTGDQLPEWSAAVAIPSERIIIMKPGDWFDPGVYRISLLHELTHLYLADKMRGRWIPLWLNEGIAMYISGKSLSWQESTIVGNAVVSENLLAFSDIDKLLKFKTGKAQIAYFQSLLSVTYLAENYGESEIINILDGLASGILIENYFQNELGLSYDDFEYSCLKWIKHQYWWMIFLQVDNLIWMGILVLVVLSILLVKIRNQRKLSEWAEEE